MNEHEKKKKFKLSHIYKPTRHSFFLHTYLHTEKKNRSRIQIEGFQDTHTTSLVPRCSLTELIPKPDLPHIISTKKEVVGEEGKRQDRESKNEKRHINSHCQIDRKLGVGGLGTEKR